MSPPRIQAVVFDLDGLMFNTEELYEGVGHELCRRRNQTYTKELSQRMMGRPSHISLQIMIDELRLGESVPELLAESDEIFHEILKDGLALMPGLLELLSRIEQRRLPVGIATSSRRPYVEYVLSRFGLQPRFEFILSSEDVTHGKPAPEIYHKAAERHRVHPADMLVLEDSENGCRAAVAAGAIAIAVPGDHNAGHAYPGVHFIAETLCDPRIAALLEND